jgi:hypothetical protein
MSDLGGGLVMRIAAAMLLGLTAAAPAAAQASLEIQCQPELSAYDAVTAAPQQHRVMFEDEHVRVLQINLPPFQQEPVHVHALPSVIEGEPGGPGGAKFAYIQYRFLNGSFIEIGRHEVSPTAGYRAVWTQPEGPHAIANLSGVPVRFTRIEIKPEGCAGR